MCFNNILITFRYYSMHSTFGGVGNCFIVICISWWILIPTEYKNCLNHNIYKHGIGAIEMPVIRKFFFSVTSTKFDCFQPQAKQMSEMIPPIWIKYCNIPHMSQYPIARSFVCVFYFLFVFAERSDFDWRIFLGIDPNNNNDIKMNPKMKKRDYCEGNNVDPCGRWKQKLRL